MSDNTLIIILWIAGGVIALGTFYLIRLIIHINWLEERLTELLDENWELRSKSKSIKKFN